ncbi:MAG: glycosyltransferase [Candidatus Latescibacterota bacterium]
MATNVGGIPELISDDVEGLLVPPRDPPRLAAALRRLAAAVDLRRRLGEQAAQRGPSLRQQTHGAEAERSLHAVGGNS